MAKLALGHHREATDPGCLRAVLAELLLTFLFVFSGVASAMAAAKLGGGDTIAGLTAVAAAHALVVAVMVSAGLHVSGGHINPAVTLGLAVGGHITLFRSALYVLAQLLGASLACLLLAALAAGEPVPVHALAASVSAARGVLMEAVLTFSLLFAVYATVVDQQRRGAAGGALGPLLVGLVVGANILAGGPYSGASMNPARSFGPALVAGDWADHWVYWAGPLIGGPLAGLLYESLFMGRPGHEPLPTNDDF
ncbi:probable aquaporin TIP4-3 [Oryza brachyantha]|uniref:probable aquaporin TIP4-3 n=1 Tax=Oryza brachyantha TaxID=4533 RepID=UPI001AD9923F|nr:probable aquaporin TIP4-3 [Oryza brachyantha]